MVVRGRVMEKTCAIMIDSGATHNFIAPQAVKQLQLSTEENLSTLELADGSKFISKGKCPNVLFTCAKLHIQSTGYSRQALQRA